MILNCSDLSISLDLIMESYINFATAAARLSSLFEIEPSQIFDL
jgi:hypothetical protein